jgi:uncharacterized protein
VSAIVGVTKRQVEALGQGPKARLIVVGGAGTLKVARGLMLVVSPYFPESYQPIARAHVEAFNVLRTSAVDWTYLAPAAYFEPGERTENFVWARKKYSGRSPSSSTGRPVLPPPPCLRRSRY